MLCREFLWHVVLHDQHRPAAHGRIVPAVKADVIRAAVIVVVRGEAQAELRHPHLVDVGQDAARPRARVPAIYARRGNRSHRAAKADLHRNFRDRRVIGDGRRTARAGAHSH